MGGGESHYVKGAWGEHGTTHVSFVGIAFFRINAAVLYYVLECIVHESTTETHIAFFTYMYTHMCIELL